MNEAEKQLVVEGLKLADDALSRLMEVNDEHVKHLASLLHTVVVFGEMIIK